MLPVRSATRTGSAEAVAQYHASCRSLITHILIVNTSGSLYVCGGSSKVLNGGYYLTSGAAVV